jgi:predicted molibdopterin-dependent oxidoreductase YjgC
VVVDPRKTASAEFADLWLGVNVGTDIALSHTIAREIIVNGIHNRAFIENGTSGFASYQAAVMDWTLERGERVTGIPAASIRELAHLYARSDRAILCWTLGITEHHNAVDNVLSLINLGLLTGHIGRYGSGLNPLRGQNNVQGGGDMGAIPNKLPGFQDIEKDADARKRFSKAWGVPIIPKYGLNLTQMFDSMEHGDLRALYVIGENPASSEADLTRAEHLLATRDMLIVQDIFMTKTAELAHVVFPASVAAFETDGTVTNSERRVQRVRKALDPPGNARDDIWIIAELARRLGAPWPEVTAQGAWDELRSLSPMHRGMSWARLDALGGLQWPCPDEDHPGTRFLHARLWDKDPKGRGELAPFSPVVDDPPVDKITPEFPLRLTTGRKLDSYNTGVQTRAFASPLREGEAIEISPAEASALGVAADERVRVVSRRGDVIAKVRIDPGLRSGLVFMTFHFPEEVETNRLTIDATDPKSGTAEFKAAAVRIEKLAEPAGAR